MESIKVYGIVVFRTNTNKDDEGLIACYQKFGELYHEKEEAEQQAAVLNSARRKDDNHQFSVRELTVI